MCSQYSSAIQDTLCVTFGGKLLNKNWCQTQYTNFDCSLSHSHLPETAVALKHQEHSHTFYRVTPNMCIIYSVGNGCLCWLFLVNVDIIRDWLPLGTELPFCVGGCWTGSLYCTKLCVFITIWQNNGHLGPFFMVSRVNAYSEWIWCTGTHTDNISHVLILTWPGMTASLTSHGSVNDITRHFSWNSFLML